MKRITVLLSIFFFTRCTAQTIPLAKEGISAYKICISTDPTATELRAASILQDYFYRVTGARLPVEKTIDRNRQKVFLIGSVSAIDQKEINALPPGAFIIRTQQQNISITGNYGKGTLYGVYAFIEKYLGCRKWSGEKALVPHTPTVSIPNIAELQQPAFQYSEIYLPPAFDNEYLDWHHLQRFEDLWGLWGHSFFKLVSPDLYFKTHPEYFSLVNGKREPMQLCLSNENVLQITIASLKKRMAENPDAMYWSVSANDDIGHCECDHCKKLDDIDGGPQGSLIHFVNAIATVFPQKKITTLAYGYTAHATTHTKPASNIVIMLSSIDALRTKPLETESSAAGFRKNLLQWKQKPSTVFVWDYCTQFTNYLTPFPSAERLASDLSFLKAQGVPGIFEQGSGAAYSDLSELNAYTFARLAWDPGTDQAAVRQEFLQGYYGKAALVIEKYISLLQRNIDKNNTSLDIYGNPVNNHTDYLSPENMNDYSELMDEAEKITEADHASFLHVQQLRLSQEYVFLQQAKFYGKDQHGIFVQNNNGDFIIRPKLSQRIERFTALCEKMQVKELSEGGITPADYEKQWLSILRKGPADNLAVNATVTLVHPYAAEYPSKKERTLVDETPGYEDFSYNWLCFYNEPLEALVDMHALKNVKTVSMHFLEDARHWIFRPSSISIEISADGMQYEKLPSVFTPPPEEDYSIHFMPCIFQVDKMIRYIKVKAVNQSAIPGWRYHPFKKPMIACDEIWVN